MAKYYDIRKLKDLERIIKMKEYNYYVYFYKTMINNLYVLFIKEY